MARTHSSALRDLGLALSLANLCLLRMWASVLCPPALVRTQHAAAIANTLALALALWITARLLRCLGSERLLAVSRALLALAVLASLPGVVRALHPAVESAPWFVPARAALFALFATAVVATSFARKGPAFSAAASRVLLALLPAVAVTVGHSAREFALLSERVAAARAAPAVVPGSADREAAGRARTRAVVLLLDELDYHLAFDARPSSVHLPALDRFRREALWAGRAYPPGGDTNLSLPASLTGRLVEEARLTADGGLSIRFPGTERLVPLRDQQTLFTLLHRQGLRSSVVGHALPYESVLGHDARCLDPRRHGSARDRLAREMANQYLAAARDSPIAIPGFLKRVDARILMQDAVRHYHAFAEAAEQQASDPAVHFTFLHALVPHVPYIFDRAKGEVTSAPGRTYLDNLVLADRTFARVRAAMEARGEWDAAAVVVMSDHWWRRRPASLGPPDHRVPFALKLAGQRTGLHYDAPVNTLLLHDLVLALFRAELREPGDVARWLDRHRTFGESPLTVGIGPASNEEPDPLAADAR